MKDVLVLGAGLVAKPLVQYLLDQPDVRVVNADRTKSKAVDTIAGHPDGDARQLLTDDEAKMARLIQHADVVVSLLPYIYHVKVATLCIEHATHMVTSSYVSDEMRELDDDAKAAGIMVLNELGVDPGIDHMSAMRIIDHVHAEGGTVRSFKSYCGGLPAPEANDNPWGYKFSWSPRGVVLAAKNSAKYLMEGAVVEIASGELFQTHWPLEVEGVGTLEAYPNRDSLPYMDLYRIPETETMYRGTLRYPGWCTLWQTLTELGYLDETEYAALEGGTYRDLAAHLIDGEADEDIMAQVAAYLGVEPDDADLEKMDWLGLFDDEQYGDVTDPLDILSQRLEEKLQYQRGERDMIVMKHEFLASYPDARADEEVTMNLVAFGERDGATAMSRTVGLPAAIATRLVLEERLDLTGVHIPVIPVLYEPILAELERLGIECEEAYQKVG